MRTALKVPIFVASAIFLSTFIPFWLAAMFVMIKINPPMAYAPGFIGGGIVGALIIFDIIVTGTRF